ncbi:MAG: hypothetical protein EHM58_17785, partial [Ignavibacteriae bacterium]
MKYNKTKLFTFLVIILCYSSLYSQNGWFLQPSPTTYVFNDVFMIDSLHGWLVGPSDSLFYTTNSGANWLGSPTGGYSGFLSSFFINVNTGWASGSEGYIIKTTNAGATWTLQSSGITIWLNSIFFVNEQTG